MLLKYNTFTIIWAVVILVLTLVTGKTHANMDIAMIDKLVHTFMFGVLSLLMIVGLKKQHDVMFLHFKAVPISILTVCLYGALIECIQILIPGRYFEWQDMLANGFGAVVGFGLFLLIYKLG